MKNKNTQLFDLTDYQIENDFTELRKGAGYDEATKTVIDQINGWSMNVQEFENFLKDQSK